MAELQPSGKFSSGSGTNNNARSLDELWTSLRPELEPGLGYAYSGADDSRLVYTACAPNPQPY